MRTLRITIGPVEIYAELQKGAAADAFWQAAPFKSDAWVEQGFVYFQAPFNVPAEPTLVVAEAPAGAIGFWPAEGLVAIGFESPSKSPNDGLVRFRSPASVWARSRSDLSALDHVVDGDPVEVDPLD